MSQAIKMVVTRSGRQIGKPAATRRGDSLLVKFQVPGPALRALESAVSTSPEDAEMADSGIAFVSVNIYTVEPNTDDDIQTADDEKITGDEPVDGVVDNTVDSGAQQTDRKGLEAMFISMMAPLLIPVGSKSLPRGAPPAWSDTRQALNETLSYYRAYQGSSYGDSEGMRGMMFDNEADEYDFASSQIVIARGGGGREVGEDKITRTQAKDQVENWTIKSMRKNVENQECVAVILGDRYSRSLIKMPHVYNVLDWFKVTDVWWSKVSGKKVIRFRFEKHNLDQPGWWVPADYVEEFPLGCLEQDLDARKTCHKCQSTWDTVYTVGWMCLNSACDLFWKIATNGPLMRDAPSANLKYDPRFLNKKTNWISSQGPEPLVARRSVLDDTENSMNILRHGTKGIVCERCNNCIRRLRMTGSAWSCDAPNCDFVVQVATMDVKLNWVTDHERPIGHDMVPRNRDIIHPSYSRFFERRQFYNGGYKILRYDLKDTDCFVVHLIPNLAPLEANLGANELFDVMQKADLPLMRRALSAAPTRGTMVTNHYTLNIVGRFQALWVSIDSHRACRTSSSPLPRACPSRTFLRRCLTRAPC
jgi:hypothetical protein